MDTPVTINPENVSQHYPAYFTDTKNKELLAIRSLPSFQIRLKGKEIPLEEFIAMLESLEVKEYKKD